MNTAMEYKKADKYAASNASVSPMGGTYQGRQVDARESFFHCGLQLS